LQRTTAAFLKFLTIFAAGGFAYGLIEIFARGFTHISMGILGGAAMYMIHLMNVENKTPIRIFSILAISSLFITLGELITGEIVNVRMGLNVWDYSMMPFNYDGQICLPFSLIWFALSSVGILFDDFLRIELFSESRDILSFRHKKTISA
jgi:uncharacterized membrane protein